jgi:hypothetical protein
MKRTALIDSLLVVVLGAILILPLFQLEYMDNWPSIESTFISDARMLNENLPHPGWQPLWYTGTRFDYIYPPALRYGTAMIAKIGQVSTARGYHLYTAIFYVLGFLAIYWLVLIGSSSRRGALFATAAVALLSPCFFLITPLRHDSGYFVPQRLHVLMAYGEGPHITALCILPGALAAAFVALRSRRPAAIAIAALLSALTVANNFYGATSLAILFPLVVWAVWNGERDWRVLPRAAAIAGLAYGLCAFWLTPSYVQITLVNMRWVSQTGNVASVIAAIALLALYGWASMRFAGCFSDREWRVFVAGATLFICLDVLGFYFFGFRIMGEPGRLVPEMDIVIILFVVELVRWAWPYRRWRAAVVALLLLASSPAIRYLRHAWTPFPKSGPVEKEYTYEITKWLHDNVPGERILPNGELRLWFNAWFDNIQMDGGSLQGILNQNMQPATYQILASEKPDLAIAWFRALGTSVIVVPDENSREHYKDYLYPHKFRGVLPVLFEDRGTTIYRVPRVHPDIARVVSNDAIESVGPLRAFDDVGQLEKYVNVVEEATQPAVSVKWNGFDNLEMHAVTKVGQAVLLQETFDPSWRATSNGQVVNIRREPMLGFMLLDVPEGEHAIEMNFETPLENRVGQVLFFVSLGMVGWMLWHGRRSVFRV